ncbi:DNA circularization N-terminal domain-containing protein [Methylomonas fluvii]|uniref:DNA circularization N-terminal domain-containing protein n=1 Tax=Methylomonas fluvii TaxID=1854564 RepID=A0ABR9DKZ8_9GAMM|nr:DNA circularization N-terminal domain-containing protein [Methylomonas fluvii]MBD9362904.1 DNA circularization N-terminal domain-containing protein [Methylomonas fluvii]CAD6876089.1 Phage tail/DNA circulation protein [Methylomonas fluvii]
MAESYQDRWSNAVWRGITFLTDAHDAKGGRRLAVHEFPGAELPEVEDLGGKAGDYQLNAYFIGPDYDREVDALIDELNKPGSDWLVHPWLGRIWVAPVSWTRHEANSANGYGTLAISWVAGGQAPEVATQDQVDAAYAGIDGFADASVADFDLLAMGGGVTDFVAAVQNKLEWVRQAISLASLPLTWSQQILGVVGSIKTEAGTLSAMPGRYAATLRSLTGLVGMGGDSAGLAVTDRPRLVARTASLSAQYQQSPVSSAVLIDSTVRANLQADAVLNSRLWLSSACQVALADYQSEADRDAVLATLNTAFDALIPTLPDPVFQAAVTARAAVITALLAQDLKPLQSRDIVAPLPSTLLAHRMQIDEAALLARNGVRHPLFVQGRVYG